MKFLTVLHIAFVGVLGNAQASESMICGRSLGQQPIENVEVPCPENKLCFAAWTRRELIVEELLDGPAVAAQITVTTIQTDLYTPEYDAKLRFFVEKPIVNEEKRKLLGADFILVKWALNDDAQTCATSPAKGATNG